MPRKATDAPRRALEVTLAGVRYFQALRPDELVRVAAMFQLRSLAKGAELVLGPGDDAEMVLVVTGTALLELPDDRRRLHPGDRYGDLSLDTPELRPARFEARLRPVTLALLDRAGVERVMREFPAVAVPLCEEIAADLRWKSDLLRDLEVIHQEGLADEQRRLALASRKRKLASRRRGVIRAATRTLWRRLVLERASEPIFWVFTGFLVALLGARMVVRTILTFNLQKKLVALITSPDGLNPIHVHHFNYGILLVVLVGIVALFPKGRRFLRFLGFAFGAGLGLIVDEFALLWHLHPDYYQRESYVAIVVSVLVLTQLIYFRSFYLGLVRRLSEVAHKWRG
ncbi:MAG: cyclic nucleotide-binding domain-containing protein [Deltaproteobacteria bacterium]|nr:cyclic nucleotide-binding domain-containing protein [Deltaproteobacteria bacterium]